MVSKKIVQRAVYAAELRIDYILERKPVKNINLRVRRDGSIYVSAPVTASVGIIDAFILSRVEWLAKAQAKIKNRNQDKMLLTDNDTIYLLGRAIRLQLTQAAKNSFAYDGGTLTLLLRNIDDTAAKERLLQIFFREQCLLIFPDLFQQQYRLAQSYGVPFPELKIRWMKTLWGSWKVRKHVLTLNTRLVQMPQECIEHVLIHEMCHFFEANHSQRFYGWVEKLQPDWRQRRELLKHWSKRIL